MKKDKRTAKEIKDDEIKQIITLAEFLFMPHIGQLDLRSMNIVQRTDLLEYLLAQQ